MMYFQFSSARLKVQNQVPTCVLFSHFDQIRYKREAKGLLCTFLTSLNTAQRQTYFASGPEGISIYTFHTYSTIWVKFDIRDLNVIHLSIDEFHYNRRGKGLNS
jgi:hypothetical protein